MKEIKLPEISLVLLIGPSSSGKSTFAKKYFLTTEVISSDFCRALISDDENNLDVTPDAFELLHFMAAKRLKQGKLTVIDALNIRKEDRAKLVKLAKDNYALAAAIVLETPIRTLMERHGSRTDRNFGRNVLEKQYDNFKRSLKYLKNEGFGYTYFVDAEQEQTIVRQPLWNNRKQEHGPFDIIGDVHGCFTELQELLSTLGYEVIKSKEGNFQVKHSQNRKVIFLGDLVDRGPQTPEVLRLVIDMVAQGTALCVKGNHDDKLMKYLLGKDVLLQHGLEKTAEQLALITRDFKEEIKAFIDNLIAHYVLDDGKLIVAHAGLPAEMHGRASAAVRAFCLYGETTGEIDEFGLPVRYNWAKNYQGKAMVVYGHTPVPSAEWLNNTINIDNGCVFGGKLTALRYPEKELVSIPAKEVYSEPIRPLLSGNGESISVQQEFDDLLDISIIKDKYLVETSLDSKVIIREENAVAALEVMSRFAVDPKWLIYLPPTMSPPETSGLPDYLEHPQEVFNYFRKNGVNEVICEEKHMGSRAIAIICKTPEVAITRFGMRKAAPGIIYTRTGRRFFNQEQTELAFLEVLNQALMASGFWEKFNTDWVCLDGELLPWSSKAKDLIINQYAAVGASAANGLAKSDEALAKALNRGIPVQNLHTLITDRQKTIGKYITSYRNYCQETDGIEGLVFAPFHILATEGKVHTNQSHPWHLKHIGEFCQQNPKYLMVTQNFTVDLQNEESVNKAIAWWTDLTGKGGEGIVVKPLDYITHHKGQIIQPAMKCRGSEYLRIIYGPEYNLGENLTNLKQRSVKTKRQLAIQEFTLGVEALNRFVAHAPLRKIHECVFGVLALESEAVDPRL